MNSPGYSEQTISEVGPLGSTLEKLEERLVRMESLLIDNHTRLGKMEKFLFEGGAASCVSERPPVDQGSKLSCAQEHFTHVDSCIIVPKEQNGGPRHHESGT